MPRIRTIKPDFFTSLTVADLSYEARLTFIGLWTHVDDKGRCVDDARLVKAALWPLDDRTAKDVDVDLWELADAGLVLRYTVDGKKCMAVASWEEHQRISRPSGSKHPAPEEGEPTPKAHGVLTEGSLNPHGALDEGSRADRADGHEGSSTPHNAPEMPDSANEADQPPDDGPDADVLHLFTSENTDSANPHGALTEDSAQTPHGKGKEQGTGKGKETLPASSANSDGGTTKTARSARESEKFQAFYAAYPKKKEPEAAAKAWERALKRGADPDHIIAAAHRYAEERRGQESRYTKYPATWLNKGCYEDEPESPQYAAAAGGYQPYTDPENTNDYYKDF